MDIVKKEKPGFEGLSSEEYVAKRGVYCPVCQSNHIEGGDIYFEAGSIKQFMGCLDCDAIWYDIYKLIGYTTYGLFINSSNI